MFIKAPVFLTHSHEHKEKNNSLLKEPEKKEKRNNSKGNSYNQDRHQKDLLLPYYVFLNF